MEPALDVMSRALQGDPGARSFLECTTSIYVLDVTDVANPKTYGAWNFIHQAMNEVERFESTHRSTGEVPVLVGHVRLLTSMALRVARRSPTNEQALVATCIANAIPGSTNASQSQWLINLNLELREIVMGRIAAMAFDFSFHRIAGRNRHSAFADRVVMDTLCAILSANAVSSGPLAVKHFATEWVIPSSRDLPAFAVACVVLHLALEGTRKSSKAGTKDALQQLSSSVVSVVIIPTLVDCIGESSDESQYQENARTATKCLRALKAWCAATDLSLPQINHICNKVNINAVETLSDAMYSDSAEVVDALAELVELTVPLLDDKVMSDGRMNQVRHLLQVDEATFQDRFSPEQLKTIESKEMVLIVRELVTAIGLQRFRFTERQNKGENGVCRNLARISSSVCTTFAQVPNEGDPSKLDHGALTLLLKAAAHPSINICALALPVLSENVSHLPSMAPELLPLLQRRAITPHRFHDGTVEYHVSDLDGVSFAEFLTFRENILRDTLLSCWRANSSHYIESCTSAVEEFCSEQSSVDVSFQLEAALYCIELVGTESTSLTDEFPVQPQLSRVLSALSVKPPSLILNPLTRARACRMLRTYSNLFISERKEGFASEICLACFLACLHNGDSLRLSDDLEELKPRPITIVSQALQQFLSCCPNNYTGESSLLALQAAWDSSVSASRSPGFVTFEARLALGSGLVSICQVMPIEHRPRFFDELVSSSLLVLEQSSALVLDVHNPENAVLFIQLGDEIRLLSGLAKAFSTSISQTHPAGSAVSVAPSAPPHIISSVRKGWASIVHSAVHFSTEEHVATSLKSFFEDLLPLSVTFGDFSLLKDLCSVAKSVIAGASSSGQDGANNRFDVALNFLVFFVLMYGREIEEATLITLSGFTASERGQELGRILEGSLVETVTVAQKFLGASWASPREQGQGQPPFETKPLPSKAEKRLNDSLSNTLTMLTKCLETCPVFLLHLPAEVGMKRQVDTLLRRAVESAVSSLIDDDQDVTRSSIRFLLAFTEQLSNKHADMHIFVSDSLARLRRTMVGNLLAGVCGKFDVKLLNDVSQLLRATLKTTPPAELEAHLVAALSRDSFLLGDPAKSAAMAFFHKCVLESLEDISELSGFLDDIWEIHQNEDTEALPTSDVVERFVRKYKRL